MSRVRRPQFTRDVESDSESELDYILSNKRNSKRVSRNNDDGSGNESESEDEMSTISFGALSSAQRKIDSAEKRKQKKNKKKEESRVNDNDDNDESDSDPGFFEEEDKRMGNNDRGRKSKKDSVQKKSKHAPVENKWNSKRVSRVREIPGLLDDTKYKQSSKYQDIRFDTAYGKADTDRIREDYKFLDEYREREIQEMQSVLKDPKQLRLLSDEEREELEYRLKSTKSKLESLKKRDFEKKVISDYRHENGNKFLNKTDTRKLLQVKRFENMKKKQVDKVIERKRKRRLGKEFKQFEFHNNT